jgi:GNAT superfamily N-acetyltransferase
MSTVASIEIRNSRDSDAEAMQDLFLATFDPDATPDNCEQCMVAAQFRHHRLLFPEGQFIAWDTEAARLVGFSVTMRAEYDPTHPHLDSWWVSSGEGWLTTHRPQGEWLYAVESVVEPEFRGKGVGSLLMNARKALARRLNARGIIAGSMPRDYYTVEMSIEHYVEEVTAGRLRDTNLSKQLRMGFRIVQIIPNYVIDAESRRYGVLIRWDNPDYCANG